MRNNEQFEQYYGTLYGQRWEALRTALQKEPVAVALSEGLQKPYYLDEGSVIAVSLLPVSTGERVLDMCAAPGGKSLLLALAIGKTGSLVCNDRSSTRRQRLHRVLDEHLDPTIRSLITITSHDATRWALYERDAYDAILLDAPCSSERHVLHDPKVLANWGVTRTRRLAIQQFAMLAAALDAVRIGGYILYCTCSISPLENELVIEKLAVKRAGRYCEIPCKVPFAEPLSHGAIILPDTAHGRGPMYMCLIKREA